MKYQHDKEMKLLCRRRYATDRDHEFMALESVSNENGPLIKLGEIRRVFFGKSYSLRTIHLSTHPPPKKKKKNQAIGTMILGA